VINRTPHQPNGAITVKHTAIKVLKVYAIVVAVMSAVSHILIAVSARKNRSN
jgi:hypothetical protein